MVPDLAHSLDIPVISSARTGHQPLVGINAFPHGDSRYWPVADHILYQRYVRALAAFAYWLLENKHCVYFFPTQLRADPPVIADVRALLVQEGGEHLARQAIERPIAGVADLLATLADTDFVIATRFHAIALALRVQTPVVAISNHHKMADLMIAMNQAPYLLDIKTVTAEALIDRFTLLKLNGEAVRNEIKRRVTANQHILDRQYDLALGPTSVA